MNPNQPVIWTSVLVGVPLIALAALAQPTPAEQIEKAIKLASAVLGFAMAVFAAVKSILGVTELLRATRDDLVVAGVTAGAGALLVLASAL